MSVEENSQLASLIAKQLERIKQLSKNRASVKSRLDEIAAESKTKTEELNRIEDAIKSIKFEIANSLNDDGPELKLVGNGE
jgi:archaellum component FlaC